MTKETKMCRLRTEQVSLNPDFMAQIEERRKEHKKGKTVSLEELKKERDKGSKK